jgi:sugar/nucleoside kinase (ribokinase family)
VYLSSLGEHAKDMHLELARYLKDNTDVKLAFQPGTFQMKLGTEFLKDIYKQSEYFCCNVEEAQKILNIDSKDLPTLLLGIEKLGPKIITITDGKNGAYLRCDNKNYFQPNYPDPKAPLERTGAGDAFTSTFVSMLCLGHSPVEALKYAPINSMHVVQFVGAQRGLLNKQDIDQLLKEAPSDYEPKEI